MTAIVFMAFVSSALHVFRRISWTIRSRTATGSFASNWYGEAGIPACSTGPDFFDPVSQYAATAAATAMTTGMATSI